ncbi:MAG: TfoX family protein [Alphaproteobacteria bacterium]|nr:TfoX family protein [Alphaproteobacteria bacterium]
MAYDEKLAARVRSLLAARNDVSERKMFGGLCFMVAGSMCCGITSGDFMVRVGADAYSAAVKRPHARPMDFTGRPMKGYLFVGRDGLKTDPALKKWIALGLAYIESLPKKKAPKKKAPKTKRNRR